MKKTDLLHLIITESSSYGQFQDLEKLVENANDLSCLPLQPLYFTIIQSSTDIISKYLPHFSPQQRQALLDLDLWNRDELDTERFFFWMESYSKCVNQDTRLSFAKSETFLLLLKGTCIISSFDIEDPNYPEHDSYFLTDDNLLLIEYGPDFKFSEELKKIIKQLYEEWGVEKAYSFLFKMVVDSFLIMEESEYQQKKERLKEYGQVDYFDALDIHSPFQSMDEVYASIRKENSSNPTISSTSLLQSLNSSAVSAYKKDLDLIHTELDKIESAKRKRFLQFNFLQLVNSSLSFNSAHKKGAPFIHTIGDKTKNVLLLGYDFVEKYLQENNFEFPIEGLFSKYDFKDLFRIGNSLISINLRKMKKALSKFDIQGDSNQSFLGQFWSAFLEGSFSPTPKLVLYNKEPRLINSVLEYEDWDSKVTLFQNLIPFIHRLHMTFRELKESDTLNDYFYLNYNVQDIDFEAILISSYINFLLGTSQKDGKKLGITIKELKSIYPQICKGDRLLKTQKFNDSIIGFQKSYGLHNINHFQEYFQEILEEQLVGIDFNTLKDEDFQHIGGPILLKT